MAKPRLSIITPDRDGRSQSTSMVKVGCSGGRRSSAPSEYDQGYADGVAAMRALFAHSDRRVLEMGPLAYDRLTDSVLLRQRYVEFNRSHRRIIEALLTGRVVTREMASSVLATPAGGGRDYDNLLSVHISAVRRRLIVEHGAPKDVILTRWGCGYQLNPRAAWGAP